MKLYQSFFKRFLDIVCALAGILGTLPLWIVAAVGIEFSDPGPVFYRANRVGKDNKIFRMYKFRSMRAGKANERVFRGDESRIFPFGQFLRMSKIDELPQLLNILLGDMSVVGPRPAAVDQLSVVRTGDNARVSSVHVGLTGPSALYDYIYGDTVDGEDNYEKLVLPTRLKLDLYYVDHQSFGYDIKMIWWTVRCIICTVCHISTQDMYDELVRCAA